jgi:indoleamine 2,3-dioxygenase
LTCESSEAYNFRADFFWRIGTALFRDYTFAASAYLLEPCDIAAREGKEALGRTRLPASLAVPLTKVSTKIGAKPFMEYAQSYSLYNYQRKDSSKGLDYPNLDLIRTFSGSQSEHGFILIHVAMVAHSGGQVKHTAEALEALRRHDRPAFNASLKGLLGSLRSINRVMDTMWNHSYPEDYANFRGEFSS